MIVDKTVFTACIDSSRGLAGVKHKLIILFTRFDFDIIFKFGWSQAANGFANFEKLLKDNLWINE